MIKPDNLGATVAAVLSRAPQWLRRDLAAPDPSGRARAEEALAAMIQAALEDDIPEK